MILASCARQQCPSESAPSPLWSCAGVLTGHEDVAHAQALVFIVFALELFRQAAQCNEFVERLAEGWHTSLGEQGGRLSGGERQRHSIARALLKDAPIVILDEPTASLDSENERAVQRTIDSLVRERTVIVIAHRLSTVVGARQILVLDAWRIVQRDNHAQLLAQNGRYRDMWQAQQAVKAWNLGASTQR